MRVLSWLTVGGLAWALVGPLPAQEQDKDAKALIDRAIKATGGTERLDKHAAFSIKGKGHVTVMAMKLSVALDISVQQPDKIRQHVEVEVNNQKVTSITVFDGQKAWVHVLDKTQEIKDAKVLAEFKESLHAQRVVFLHRLGKDFGLSPLGEVKIKDKPAAGVRVSFKGRRDINLYFDKETGLVVKSEYRGLDPISMKEVTKEDYYSDYKETGGVKNPGKVVSHHDGEVFFEVEITEGRFLERHDEGVFAKP